MRPTVQPHLIVMARQPRMGAVKTRLARDAGACAALRFYRTQLHLTLLRLIGDPRWRSWIAVTPDNAVHSYPRAGTLAQGGGDLGQRMQRVFGRLPPGPALIVGCDIPEMRPHHVAAAFRALGHADAVFGPSDDGGYWLVGLRRLRRTTDIFKGVRWSTGHALADTLQNLHGLRVERAASLRDVDGGADLAAAGPSAFRLIAPPRRAGVPRAAA